MNDFKSVANNGQPIENIMFSVDFPVEGIEMPSWVLRRLEDIRNRQSANAEGQNIPILFFGGAILDLASGRMPRDLDMMCVNPRLVTAVKSYNAIARETSSQSDFEEVSGIIDGLLGTERVGISHSGPESGMRFNAHLGNYMKLLGHHQVKEPEEGEPKSVLVDMILCEKMPEAGAFFKQFDSPIRSIVMSMDADGSMGFAYHSNFPEHFTKGIFAPFSKPSDREALRMRDKGYTVVMPS